VLLAGTTVKRASLHNADQIEKLDVREGDHVYIEKGGEIIPKIVAVQTKDRNLFSQPTTYISTCPECQSVLIRKEGEAQHYCPSDKECPPQIKGKIEHFISRKAMNIDGLGAETIHLFFKERLVVDVADLYKLKKEDLLPLERMAEKSATNIIDSISKSKQITFERVLYALGIRYIGVTVAKKLARHFHSIEALKKASLEELIHVDEIGNRIAESLMRWFTEEDNQSLINKLHLAGIQLEIDESLTAGKTDILKEKSFVISGVFQNHSREELKNFIEKNGGKNTSSLSKKTSFLVAGDKMGPSKKEKAEKLAITIISEDELISMVS
jgi:DNA ligase (NAD+)